MDKSTKYLLNGILLVALLIGLYHIAAKTVLTNRALEKRVIAYYNAASQCQVQLARILKPAKDKALKESAPTPK